MTFMWLDFMFCHGDQKQATICMWVYSSFLLFLLFFFFFFSFFFLLFFFITVLLILLVLLLIILRILLISPYSYHHHHHHHDHHHHHRHHHGSSSSSSSSSSTIELLWSIWLIGNNIWSGNQTELWKMNVGVYWCKIPSNLAIKQSRGKFPCVNNLRTNREFLGTSM